MDDPINLGSGVVLLGGGREAGQPTNARLGSRRSADSLEGVRNAMNQQHSDFVSRQVERRGFKSRRLPHCFPPIARISRYFADDCGFQNMVEFRNPADLGSTVTMLRQFAVSRIVKGLSALFRPVPSACIAPGPSSTLPTFPSRIAEC